MSYILIAEDDRDILLLVQRKLEMNGYTEIWTTSSGSAALEQALAQPPRLLILDVMLNDLNGLTVCAEVKQQLAPNAPPVIIMSARGQKPDLEDGMQAGADVYLVKPFSPRDLVEKIQALLGE